ncbi:hypothetical protein PR003_g14668 [Phytophthora rubi]|uniref:Ubiquitin-protein ligase E3A N-terminal zinc-binding domain-containing protein n=1 Tax=Phytophthora rubi TaxID=129364 RepID=A0A6A3LU50_9STRA|nr:hypothetical protein PR002_g14552 [Phytophthora rubi]KAE9019794.1 hypothetical protein PR001_g13791 [Phytophthora rubi]KAE9332138.1 hypothetical protein PR003_g14668 [Phytophthora rubi]
MDLDQVGGVSGSSDACLEVASTTDYVYARQLVQAYFVMLTAGCKRDDCTNENCCSSPQFPALTATEAVIRSVYFATQAPVPLCVDLDQNQDELLLRSATEIPPHPEQELVLGVEQPQAIEENQVEDALSPNDEDQQCKQELHPETPENEVLKTPQSEGITATEDDQHSQEELHPETSEAERPKFQQPESITTEPAAETPVRKSTPRRRLSVAVKLDNGLNKGRESPAKRPTVITRVVVQPKHKSAATSLANDVTLTTAAPGVTEALEAEVVAASDQQQELAASKLASPAQDVRQRRLSRPKEKLFDAIKRSFSRTKKAPLGSA